MTWSSEYASSTTITLPIGRRPPAFVSAICASVQHICQGEGRWGAALDSNKRGGNATWLVVRTRFVTTGPTI